MAEAKHIPQGGRPALVEPGSFDAVVQRGLLKARTVGPKMFDEGFGSRDTGLGYTIENGVAVVRVDSAYGFRPDWFEQMVYGTIDSEELARTIERAAMDPAARAVMIELDCPGSTCEGTSELTRAVRAAKAASGGKPFGAFANEKAFSGGYWLACLCDTIGMTPSAGVGSIGVRWSMYDYAGMFEEAGVKPVLNETGKFKSVGLMGRPFSDEDQKYLMVTVEHCFTQFIEVVTAGRGIDEATVRGFEAACFTAPDALKNKLVDVVTSRGEFLRGLVSKAAPVGAQARKAKAMTASELREQHGAVVAEIEAAAKEAGKAEATTAAAKPATFAQLDAAFGTDSAFVTECQRADRSLAAAHAAWTDRLVKNTAEQAAKIAALETEVANLKALPSKGKATPVAGGPATPGTDSYTDLVKVEMSKGSDRMTAELAVQKANPKAYTAHVTKTHTDMRGGKSTADIEDDDGN
jgi:signal peptide peptidase SppA